MKHASETRYDVENNNAEFFRITGPHFRDTIN